MVSGSCIVYLCNALCDLVLFIVFVYNLQGQLQGRNGDIFPTRFPPLIYHFGVSLSVCFAPLQTKFLNFSIADSEPPFTRKAYVYPQ